MFVLRTPVSPRRVYRPQAEHAWSPAVDVREEEERFVIAADVPGVDSSSLDITLHEGVLTLKGEKKRVEVDGALLIGERRSGVFSRSFNLPESVDGEAISARCRDGVLEVVIPKRAKPQPRTIEIH
ncbi:MAG: heat-shock protein [Alphaproteobacteria bacterium CG_4_10_14_0_2_um_filter_63_37]|nr:MAG: hypothetical protein AUJ55_05245 [Proteobacteria bacterium CG1_02_64_396]PJA25090.1 MAG: heat-shock protein [Alphaproteobacteria bacterium CG_4_10_14_0_2_um_filter_63_37]